MGLWGRRVRRQCAWNTVWTRYRSLLPERLWVVPTYLFLFIKELKNIIISILKNLLCMAHLTTTQELKNGSRWKSLFMTLK